MQIDIFTLCDAATFSGSSLNLLGTFDTIRAVNFPCMHGSFSVVASVRFSMREVGPHVLVVHRIDLDGVILDSSKPERFEIELSDKITDTYSLIWNIRNKEFRGEEESYFDLRVDEVSLARVPLYVKRKKVV